MTAEDIFYLRTKKDGDDYLEIAEQDVRAYLRYLDTESVEQFASTIANIAVLYFRRDQALSTMAQAEITTGVKSESFTEGKVSPLPSLGRDRGLSNSLSSPAAPRSLHEAYVGTCRRVALPPPYSRHPYREGREPVWRGCTIHRRCAAGQP